MITGVANIERIAAIKRKIYIIMLLKNDFLLLPFLDLSNSCPFCLCCLTRSFNVFGGCNNLVSISDVCHAIGNTCYSVAQFLKMCMSNFSTSACSIKLSK